ncbi:MAG: DUF3418 domain-containing protein, partial [Marmoricola sp.]
DRVVPDGIVSGAHFDSWWKQERRQRPDLLDFDPKMLVHDAAGGIAPGDFPDAWREGSLELPLRYHFEPGAAEDGVRVDVPLATLNHLGPRAFSWHVPGLREELVIALLRSLPKQLRVNFVPAPNVAKAFLAAVPPGEESLTDALARYLLASRGVAVPEDAWDWAKVPEHLKPTFRILDEDGTLLGEGKDLEALKRPLRPSYEAAVAGAAQESGLAASGQSTWTFGTVEQSFVQVRAGHEVRGYPGLVDEGGTVGLRVFASTDEQLAQHRLGVRRLLVLGTSAPDLGEGLDNATKLVLAGSSYPNVKELLADCALAALGDLAEPVWDEAAFAALLARARTELPDRATTTRDQVIRVLRDAMAVDRLLGGRVELAVLLSMNDMRAHLGRLTRAGFVADAGGARLQDFPRYLAALTERHRRLQESSARDLELMGRIAAFQDGYEQRLAALPPGRPPGEGLVRLGWLVEEYRVSLWAQHLGTREPVSDARLRTLMNQV